MTRRPSVGEGWRWALLALAAALSLYFGLFRPWMLAWGSTPQERSRAWPGDRLVPRPRMQTTRAVTLEGRPAEVWPWLLQLGTGRGGWYSYDCLDNGCHPSAEAILPQYQGLREGDRIPMSPDGRVSFPVALLQKEKVLGLGGPLDLRAGRPPLPGQPRPERYMNAIWAMVLEPAEGGRTRLVLRYRMELEPGWLGLLGQAALEPIHFIMERKMLLELRRRLSRQAAARGGKP